MSCAAASTPGSIALGTTPALALVWGLGSGRRVRELLRQGLHVEVLALDVDPERPELATAIVSACPRLRDALVHGRLRVIVGSPAELGARLQTLSGDRVDVHVDLAALSAVPEPARALARTVERLHLEQLDLQRFASRMRRNLRDNLDAITGAGGVDFWHGAAVGQPVFVLAAGPSARAAMPMLHAASRRGPVVAVDTALPLCREFEVPIDVLVSVDPHPESAVHLQRGCDGVGTLAFQPFCAPAVVDAIRPRVLGLPRGDALCDRAAVALGLPSFHVAGTVLLFALQIAELLGAAPVVLVGADFAHLGGRTHAEGTATSRVVEAAGCFVRNANGDAVASSSSLRRFHAEVEHYVTQMNRPVWHVDAGGAAIAGCRSLTLPELTRWCEALPRRSTSLPTPPDPAPDEHRRRIAIWDELLRNFDGA
ncbi:MAG: DUF115 domain-containing protein [Deltaproteobacteria bacterium]|nr:DUF115 domain-containing protein [Deltaproteobacteria bacterium]MBK8240762.1 DUF115 domain-containing protein [Deltaproteobacteria bacterium]MBK8714243.1 DUF115 domain-containing protein [Deltaproteobacteria bacterium]MBP7285967.1 DUF115 domain-containing protein [Nannocystaceae bacterium]